MIIRMCKNLIIRVYNNVIILLQECDNSCVQQCDNPEYSIVIIRACYTPPNSQKLWCKPSLTVTDTRLEMLEPMTLPFESLMAALTVTLVLSVP